MLIKIYFYVIHIFVMGCFCNHLKEMGQCMNTKSTQSKMMGDLPCLENYPGLKTESNGFDGLYLFDLKVREEADGEECDGSIEGPWEKAAESIDAHFGLICHQKIKSESVLRVVIEITSKQNRKIMGKALIVERYNEHNTNGCFLNPIAYQMRDCSQKCGKNAQCSTIYGVTKCRCKDGYRGDPLKTCSPFCTEKEMCGLYFPDTRTGNVAVAREKCSKENDPSRSEKSFIYVSALCQQNGQESSFDFSNATVIPCGKTIDSVLKTAGISSISEPEFNQYTSYLQALTVNSSSLNEDEVEGIVDFINSTIQRSRKQKFKISATTSLRSIALVVSQLSSGYFDVSVNSSRSYGKRNFTRVQQKLAEDFPRICLESSFDQNEKPEFEIQTSTFALKRDDVNLTKPENVEYTPIIQNNNGSESTPVSLFIPANVIQESAKGLSNESSASTQPAAFIYYKENTFFPSNETVLNVLSVSVGRDEKLTSKFPEPISIKHQNMPQANNVPVKGNFLMVQKLSYECVFWNFSSSEWSREGCCLNRSSNPPQCLCNHMTNFALLVKSENVLDDTVLSTITILGCSLSVVGLLFTIALLIYNKELQKFRSGKILLHLCCALAIAYLTFVSGVSNAVGRPTACTVVAVLLHYFFLVSMCWMTVYSFEMYSSLVKVFASYRSGFLTKSSIFSYLSPAAIVALSLGISSGTSGQNEAAESFFCGSDAESTKSNNYRSDIQCWIKGSSLYFGFLLPIGIMVLYNFVVFCLVTKELRKQNKNSAHLRRSTVDSLIIAVTMTCVMGLTWIFGFLLLLSHDQASYSALSWIFAITNTLQGFGIFLLTSVRREDMRNIWWVPIKNALSLRDKMSSSNSSYSSTVLTKSQSKKKKKTESDYHSQAPLTEA